MINFKKWSLTEQKAFLELLETKGVKIPKSRKKLGKQIRKYREKNEDQDWCCSDDIVLFIISFRVSFATIKTTFLIFNL